LLGNGLIACNVVASFPLYRKSFNTRISNYAAGWCHVRFKDREEGVKSEKLQSRYLIVTFNSYWTEPDQDIVSGSRLMCRIPSVLLHDHRECMIFEAAANEATI
jgi:hypothetical protein